jgi:hypothetical protein
MRDLLKGFLNPNGSTSHQGQQNAGAWEARNYSQPAPQQAHESWSAYSTRTDAFNSTKNNAG